MRLVVCTGSRGWRDVRMVYDTLSTLRRPFVIVVGDAQGWDTIVWAVATRLKIPRVKFKYIGKLGKAGGHARDAKMLKWALARDPRCYVLAGWDGSSPGTKGTMQKAEKLGIDIVRVAYYESTNREV